MKRITRRSFLRYGAAGAATVSLPTIVPSGVLGSNGTTTPGNQITIGPNQNMKSATAKAVTAAVRSIAISEKC